MADRELQVQRVVTGSRMFYYSAYAVLTWLLVAQHTKQPTDDTTVQKMHQREIFLKKEMKHMEAAMNRDNNEWGNWYLRSIFSTLFGIMLIVLLVFQINTFWKFLTHEEQQQQEPEPEPEPEPQPQQRVINDPFPMYFIEVQVPVRRQRRASWPGADAPPWRNFASVTDRFTGRPNYRLPQPSGRGPRIPLTNRTFYFPLPHFEP
ncbi:uncharacterized protein [Hyperolius riggenbachi]|uniref:uncharacterized protein n=1 Tax=Hyperolius riggenbachi TaxID=752182 RepID=UPI0035A29BEA